MFRLPEASFSLCRGFLLFSVSRIGFVRTVARWRGRCVFTCQNLRAHRLKIMGSIVRPSGAHVSMKSRKIFSRGLKTLVAHRQCVQVVESLVLAYALCRLRYDHVSAYPATQEATGPRVFQPPALPYKTRWQQRNCSSCHARHCSSQSSWGQCSERSTHPAV